MLSNQSSKRNNGSAAKLKGKCFLLSIFLGDQESFWSPEEKKLVLENMKQAVDFILFNAKNYGIHNLEFFQDYIGLEDDIHYPYIIPTDMFEHPDWTEYALDLSGLDNGINAVKSITRKYRVKNVVLLIHVNKPGTSYNLSYSLGVDPVFYAERDVMFFRYENGEATYAASYAHEILHCFGAGELYFPFDQSNDRFLLAQSYFPNDVMHRVDCNIYNLTISEYTAYRVGWLNALNKKYSVFEDPL